MAREPRTVVDLVNWGAARLRAGGAVFGHGTDNAHDEAVVLVCHALGLPADVPRHFGQRPVSPDESARAAALLRRRLGERIPAAYLTGEAWFAGLPFTVDPRVAIPRSPIAELIEQGFAPWYADQRQPILDLCTGSGCIAVAAAVYLKQARIDAVDISAAAVDVAQANARRHGVDDRVTVLCGDLFAPLPARRYGLIVSNPPYVGAPEMAALPAEYRHEPEAALASGSDGLDLPVRILAGAAERLVKGGSLIMEVGDSEQALTRAFPQVPFLSLEFRRGGHGVLLLSCDDLVRHRLQLQREHARRTRGRE